MAVNEELVGVFAREKKRFENDDGDVIVGVLSDAKEIKGPCEVDELKSGLRYRFFGHMTNHAIYGDQFKFNSFTLETPYGEEETVSYLSQVRGIGPMTAMKLWDTYGAKSIQVIKENPEEIVNIVRGFNAEKALEAQQSLIDWEKTEYGKIKLMGLLKGRGFLKSTSQKCLEKWGIRAAELIERNPYRMIGMPGCTFDRCDELYKDLASKLPPEQRAKRLGRIKRQALCMWSYVKTDTNGHTWYDVKKAITHLEKTLNGANVNVTKALKLALKGRLLTGKRWCDVCKGVKVDLDGNLCEKCNGTGGNAWVTTADRSLSEYYVATGIANSILDEHPVNWPKLDASSGLFPEQLEESAKSLSTRIGVLVGCPGTGKTFTVCAISRAIIAAHGSTCLAVCAPTGMASQRINELLAENHVKGINATTVHRMLGVSGTGDGDNYRFLHGPGNPLPYDYIILDEASMEDTEMFGCLLAAIRPGGHLLIVGDPNQLSPIGHGCPLRDLIRSNTIGVGELTKIQRNSGLIVQICKQIREEHTFDRPGKIDLANGKNLGWIECNTPEKQVEAIVNRIEAVKKNGKYDPVWDVQVIVAINENSLVSRKSINERLQALLNPHGAQIAGNPFRVKDKIVNTKNNYYTILKGFEKTKDDERNDNGQLYVANGELARVDEVYITHTIATIMPKDVTIRLPNAKKAEDEKGGSFDWEPAYGVTGHKIQGSERKLGLIVIDHSPGARMVCSREWLYTVFSRFKVACEGVGRYEIAKQFCCRSSIMQRKTFLVERISEALERIAKEKQNGQNQQGVEHEVHPEGRGESKKDDREDSEDDEGEDSFTEEEASFDPFAI